MQEYCRKTDEARLAYLTGLYQASGKYSDSDAAAIACIEYSAMVGCQQIRPDATPKEMTEMYQVFLKLTGRIPG